MYQKFVRKQEGGIGYFCSPLFLENGVFHLFATRFGGVSGGDFESLNFSTVRRDRKGLCDFPDNVAENMKRISAVARVLPDRIGSMKQIHSATVLPASTDILECDGIFSDGKGNVDALCVKTADCVPILLYDTVNDTFCAIHAGWRGTVSGICINALCEMRRGRDDTRIIAAIGPSIGKCCYEVGCEVLEGAMDAASIAGTSSDAVMPYFEADSGGKYKADLAGLNAELLKACGIPDEDISVCDICTCCYEENGTKPFFSHRASGGFSGTQISLVKSRKK